MSLSKRQLALRRGAVGGSEVAVLAGCSKWSTPIEVWESKVLGATKPITEPMFFGVVLEEPIAQVYAAREGRWLRRVDSLINGRYPLAIATPDRAVFSAPRSDLAKRRLLGLSAFREAEKGLEVKSSTWRQRDRWGKEGSDFIPDEYATQVTWHMGVTEVKVWDVAVLFDRDEFRVYRVHFDEQLFLGLYELASKFMRDFVIPRRPPPPDASEQYSEFLGRRWGSNRSELLQTDDEFDALAARLGVLDELQSRVALAHEWTTNQLKARIAEAGGVAGAWGNIYWRRERARAVFDARSAFDAVKAAVLALPDGDVRGKLAATIASLETLHTRSVDGKRPLKAYFTKDTRIALAGMTLSDFAPALTQNNPQDNQPETTK